MNPSWYDKVFSRGAKPFDLTLATAKADSGDAEAQFALGMQYGIQDFARAAHWYRKAAEQNHPSAQYNLGLMYAKGEGVSRDDRQAIAWMQKAAQQGEAAAQFDLGLRYHRASVWGLQLDSNDSRIEAYKWLQLAAAQGYKGSEQAWELVTKGMTREEVNEGNHDAAAFRAVRALALKD